MVGRWLATAVVVGGALAACGTGPEVGPGAAPAHTWEAAGAAERCALDKALATADPAGLARLGLDAPSIDKILSLRGDERGSGSLAAALEAPGARDRALTRALADGRTACGVAPLRLLAFNDFHGQLEPPSGRNGEIQTPEGPVPAGGVEYFATWIEALRRGADDVVVVAAGDNIGATPLISAAFHDEPTIEALDAVGLQITSVGNHEFDEGIVELQRMQAGGCHPSAGCFGGDGFAGAHFRYLAANVVREDGGGTLFPAYTVRRVGRAEVAFIGMTLEGTPSVVTAAGVAGVRFLDEAETVNRLVPELVARGIETIVVLVHEGGFATGSYDGCEGISGPVFDIVRAFDPEVDVVVTGHTNAAHVCDIDGRLVTSAAHYGRLVTQIDLTIDELTGEVQTKGAHNVIVRRDVARAPALTALVDRYRELVKAYADAVVTTVPADLTRQQDASGQSALGALIADAQLAAESDPSTGGAEIAFMNPGGIRSDIGAGEVTFGELFAVQPFNNDLVTLTLTGAQLEAVLEEQWGAPGEAREPKFLQVSASLTYTWDKKRPAGDKIASKDIRVGGKPLDPARAYRVVMNHFLAGGGDGFTSLKAGIDRKIGIVDLDALVLYLKQHPGYTAAPGGRVKAR